MKLDNLTPDLDISKIRITAGYRTDRHCSLRGILSILKQHVPQVIGFVEYTYMEGLAQGTQEAISIRQFLSFDIPAVVFCNRVVPDPYS